MVARDAPDTVGTAQLPGSGDAFGELTSPYRRELLVHCYRMLGSIDDAEDALQDALARAWRGRNTFQRAISFRAWLYRIATNACLDAIERRKRSREAEESLEVGPIPDDLLDETTAGPEARYDSHESISLAFLTAIQLLPPRQRAVLILRDVLSLRAAEVAALLELSVPAVNSALHRARSTVAGRYEPPGAAVAHRAREEPGRLHSILDRYVRAWEAADVAGLVALLRDDAVVSMAPGLSFTGPADIGAFVARSVFSSGLRIRLRPVRANRRPAFVVYSGSPTDAVLVAYAVVVLDIDGTHIGRMDVFADRRLIARFGVPAELAA
jgi:RNA polymerase sigma-70 factor (TIGR02960 family)